MDTSRLIDYAALLVGSFAVAHNVWVIANVFWTERWLGVKRTATLPDEPQAFVVILLPLLEEQTTVDGAIDHLLALTYPKDKYRVVVITSAREKSTNKPSTVDVVTSITDAKHTSRLLHFHTDGSDGSKADQLNQCIRWLDGDPPQWWTDDVVVGVYDADSRPESTSLLDLDSQATLNPTISAFQQPAVYLAGIERLPPSIKGAYLRSRPLYNFRFCMYREIPGFYRSLLSSRTRSLFVRLLFASPNHFLGHGEFVRLPALRQVGGFPPPSADTSLGTVLSFLGHAIMPLSTFDVGETPHSIGILTRQGATWYAGCSLYLRDLRLALGLGVRLQPHHITMVIKRWVENMIWCFGPLLLLIAATWGAYRNMPVLLAACVGAAMLHWLSVLMVMRSCVSFAAQLRTQPALTQPLFPNPVLVLVLYPIMLIMSCGGPLLYYYRKVRSVLTGRPVVRSKTPRHT